MDQKGEASKKNRQQEHIVENKELNIWEALIPVIALVVMLAFNVSIFRNNAINYRKCHSRKQIPEITSTTTKSIKRKLLVTSSFHHNPQPTIPSQMWREGPFFLGVGVYFSRTLISFRRKGRGGEREMPPRPPESVSLKISSPVFSEMMGIDDSNERKRESK